MNQQKKLIELLDKKQKWGIAEEDDQSINIVGNSVVADHLLANGVVVLPCKVGDTVYRIDKVGDYNHNWQPFVVNGVVKEISWKCNRSGKDLGFGIIVRGGLCNASSRYSFNGIGKTVFLTREEAEAELERMNNSNG